MTNSSAAHSIHDKTAIVGVGATPYYKRAESLPQSQLELAAKAILAALDDAGLKIQDVDGLAYYCGGLDSAMLAQVLGIPEVRFTATLTGGGGGSAGSIGLAAAAIVSGHADVVVSVLSLQQPGLDRLGTGNSSMYPKTAVPERDFIDPSGLIGPGQAFGLLAKRHMHLYGTEREHFAEVAISTRENAARRETALMRKPMTREDYFEAPLIADPLCLFDFCLETDGAVAIVTTSAERANDLRHDPVLVSASAQGGSGRWGSSITWMNMEDEVFASSGHRSLAPQLYERAGCRPADVDVALIYDHFSPLVIMQLEDYGFCEIGEGGPFVADGNIRWESGSLPVNTHGGNLSEGYIMGMTHVMEAVEQLRGTAVNQVDGAEVALVTGGPASIPVSSLILHN
jgi:acetyl-CoA acetyltransferase